LIEVPAVGGEPRPVHGLCASGKRERPLEPAYPREELRRHTDLLFEHVNEVSMAQVDLVGDLADGRLRRAEAINRGAHGTSAPKRAVEVREERLLEQAKTLVWGSGLAKPLPELDGGATPQRLDVHVEVRKLARRHAEEGERAAGPEVHA
jgi:hypothetical protein